MTHFINGIELTNPTIINVGNKGYMNGDEYITVFGYVLSQDNEFPYMVEFGQMENTDNWGDDEVMQFANEQLENLKIKE